MKAKQQTKLYIVIAILTLVCLALTGLTFAWFTDKVSIDDFVLNFGKIELETDTSAGTITTGSISVERNGTELSKGSYVMPGDKVEINITVKLTDDSQPAYYLVYFDGDDLFEYGSAFFFKSGTDIYAIVGELEDLALAKVNSDGSLTEVTVTEDSHVVGSISAGDTHQISFVQQIDPKATEDKLSGSKTFECTVYAIQQANMENEEVAFLEIYNKVNATVTFSGFTQSGEDVVLPAYQQAISDFYEYETISFYKTGKQPSTLTLNSTLTSDYDSYVDTEDKGKIKVYTNGDTKTELAFVSDYKIMGPENCNALFAPYSAISSGNMSSIKTATMKFDNFNTSNTTNMSYMFFGCYLTTLNLRKFDTSKVTNMAGMFYGCVYLIDLNVSSFNTSKVTSFEEMFLNCWALTILDLSSFDISNAEVLNLMFRNTFSNNPSESTLIIGDDFKVISEGEVFELTRDSFSGLDLNDSVTVKRNGSILS